VFISVTKLKVKSFWHLIPFFMKSIPAFAQARKAPGNIFTETRTFDLFTYGTLSGWESESAMRQYTASGSHLEAMKVSRFITVLLQSTHFESPERTSWERALELMELDNKSIKFRPQK